MTLKTEADIAQVLARVQQLREAGGNSTKVLGAFGRVILSRIQLGFRVGRSPWGAAWAPLSLRIGRPLVNTGQMLRSITMKATADAVDIGTNVRQGPVQQFGATIRPVNAKRLAFPGPGGTIFAREVTIPARPFMPIRPSGQVDLPPAWQLSGLQAMQKALGL